MNNVASRRRIGGTVKGEPRGALAWVNAGPIFGATPVPEPTPIALGIAGTLMILLWRRRRMARRL
jgi:uncharacterized protein (TIGR03382 family)